MELYQIRYFLALAATLNFTRAAERCFVSQPALTKAIQRLEDAVGGRLFDRGRNPVQLTELGRAMLPALQQIHDSASQAREQARQLLAEGRPLVRVGVMCTLDFQPLLAGFERVRADPHGIELRFRDGNLDALLDALDQDDLDMGILCTPHELPPRFAATPLFSEDYVVALGPTHRFNGRDGIELAELQGERYCERVLCEFSAHIARLLAERGVALQVVQQSAREDWIQALVRAGFGVAFMPRSLARAAGLAGVAVRDVPIVRQVGLLARAGRSFTPAQRTVLQALRAHPWADTCPATTCATQ